MKNMSIPDAVLGTTKSVELAFLENSPFSMNHFSHHLLLLLLFFNSLCFHLCAEADTISPGSSLSGNQTIVSKEGNFELGFFSPGTSHNYYIGIWYRKIPKQTVIWVANREIPISNPSSSELKISEDGSSLVLINHSKIPIWSSSNSTSNSTVAVLLDTGNLVLRERADSAAVIWQSFDHPTDTWMPGGWIGFNKITGEYQYLTSWKNKEEPAPGPFSYRIDEAGSSEFFLMWNGSEKYWRTGVWTGQFRLMPEVKASHKFNFSYGEDDRGRHYTYSIYDNSVTARAGLDVTGRIKLWVWFGNAQEWQEVWAQPIAQCDVRSLCGAFGVCDMKSLHLCECLDGFEPASAADWELDDRSGGCSRKTHLRCGNSSDFRGRNDEFQIVPNMQLPLNSLSLDVMSREECQLACLDRCKCTAYAYDSGCLIWNGELHNLRKLHDNHIEARNLHLRVAASELPGSSSSRKTTANVVIIFSALVGALAVFGVVLGLTWRYHPRLRSRSSKAIQGALVPFTYANLQRATKNFSEKLGGGGFGSVYKGMLPDSTVVAVKKLEGLRQGEKQFRTEVSTLGAIQHVNLVRLRGFSAEGTKMSLVYDYMPNGSLDTHLFSNSRILDWKTRYGIVLGIARGLTYLHEKCRNCIIHCDIKPENILLDKEFHPKVADFGLAKLVGRDFGQVLTTMRGTIGYLAPEWLSGVAITPKADVYSFGMVLFEVISGRRNKDKCEDGKIGFFPLWAAFKVNEGKVLELLDEKLEGVVDMEELTRAFRVACWCIQDCEDHRPSMGRVVQILEAALEVSLPPIPRSLRHLVEVDVSSFCHSEFSSIASSEIVSSPSSSHLYN